MSETNNIDVFGNLKDFLGGLTERQVAQELERLEQIRSTMPTPAQSAYIGTLFAPGSGVADVAGELPSFPTADVPLEDFLAGEPLPSLPANIEEGRYLDAFLQSLGAAGDALYATPAVGPLLGGTVKGIAAIPPVVKGLTKPAAKGIEGLRQQKIQEDVQQFARDSSKNAYADLEGIDVLVESVPNQTSYVSPTLEALIAKAPPNLKGEQISNWLKANTDKGVKPKELELLDLDSYIMQNPNATVRDVAEYGSENKVQLVTRVIQGEDAPTIDFEVTTPDFDPLDPTLKNYQPDIDNAFDYLAEKDSFTQQDILDFYNEKIARNLPGTSTNPRGSPGPFKKLDDFEEIDPYLKSQSGKQYTGIDDVVEEYARDLYMTSDPYELIEIKSTGAIDVDIPDQTFAFGNDEVGYNLFIGGERVTDDANIAYSRTEAQIQLRDKLSEGADPLRIEGEEDPYRGPRYKPFIDDNLPGGSDYREYVINWGNAPEGHNVSTHFPDEKQISSVLARERKLEDGTTSLHIDEMQSDLHTRGSKQGYRTPEFVAENKAQLDAKEIEIQKKVSELKPIIEKYLEPYKPEERLIFARFEGDEPLPQAENIKRAKTEAATKVDNFFKAMENPTNRFQNVARKGKASEFAAFANNQLLVSKSDMKVLADLLDVLEESRIIDQKNYLAAPDYPFKDDWHNMTLKNMVLQAIEEGKDSVSVSTSYAMKTRYSDKYDSFYETLYDKKIPSAMKKLANKYGGKYEKMDLDVDDISKGDIRYPTDNPLVLKETKRLAASNVLRITPEMKQKILEEGMPSFAYGGPVNKFIGPNEINVFND